jgi:SAM-dependent methyltransferase
VVELKSGPVISFTLRFARRDETRNEPFTTAVEAVGKWLKDEFGEGHLFTTAGDWKLRSGVDGEGSLKASRPTFSVAPPIAHDRVKERAMSGAAFMVKLGVTAADGTARAGMADKLRQVERFVEILGHLVDGCELREARAVRVCDMGAGKGYLTFAAHEFFRLRGVEADVVGVEQRAELVERTNAVARELGCTGLRFERGTIADFSLPERLDILIALHACDTATDDALAAGVRAGARLLVVSPCCHKEVRGQLALPPVLRGVLRHGFLAERQSELLTDGLRALALETRGYDASVFEFIANEHTGKNVMIAATMRGGKKDGAASRSELEALMEFFGLRTQRLVELLSRAPCC